METNDNIDKNIKIPHKQCDFSSINSLLTQELKCELVKKLCSGFYFNMYELHYCDFESNKILSSLSILLLLLICFYLLTDTANNYFEPSLTILSEKFKLSPSIAAMTFLALGNGAPDVISSIVAANSGSDVNGSDGLALSLGALLGSGVFIICCVFSLVIIFSNSNGIKVVPSMYKREIVCYITALILLAIILLTKKIYLFESVIFFSLYFINLFLAFVSESYTKKKEKKIKNNKKKNHHSLEEENSNDTDIDIETNNKEINNNTKNSNNLSRDTKKKSCKSDNYADLKNNKKNKSEDFDSISLDKSVSTKNKLLLNYFDEENNNEAFNKDVEIDENSVYSGCSSSSSINDKDIEILAEDIVCCIDLTDNEKPKPLLINTNDILSKNVFKRNVDGSDFSVLNNENIEINSDDIPNTHSYNENKDNVINKDRMSNNISFDDTTIIKSKANNINNKNNTNSNTLNINDTNLNIDKVIKDDHFYYDELNKNEMTQTLNTHSEQAYNTQIELNNTNSQNKQRTSINKKTISSKYTISTNDSNNSSNNNHSNINDTKTHHHHTIKSRKQLQSSYYKHLKRIERKKKIPILLNKVKKHYFTHKQEYKKLSIIRKILYIIMILPLTVLRDLSIPAVEQSQYNHLIFSLFPISSFIIFISLTLLWKSFFSLSIVLILSIIILLCIFSLVIYFLTDHKITSHIIPVCFVSFIMSIIWIWATSNLIVDLLEFLGTIFNLPSSFLGLTFLAIGNSASDASLNIALARSGFSEMALNGSISGPLFNLVFGLGISLILLNINIGVIDIDAFTKDSYTTIIGFFTLLVNLVVILWYGYVRNFYYTKSIAYISLILFGIYISLISYLTL